MKTETIILFLSCFSLVFSLSPQATGPSTATWIGDSLPYIGSKTLKQLTIPGTHDSGTYWLSDTPLPGDSSPLVEAATIVGEALFTPTSWIIKGWSHSQDQIFYNQMKGGMRYFDVRSGWDNKTQTWVAHHYLEGSPVSELLGNISQYLQDYPNEVVIVEMTHFDGYPTQANIVQLKNMALQILGNYIYPINTAFNFTLNDWVSSGKRAIVTMESGAADGIWPGECIYNTYADSPVIKTMINFNTATVAQYMNGTWPNELFKISWTLTPDANAVFQGAELGKPHTLIELADTGNPYLPQFWLNMKAQGYRVGNILIIDHYEQSSIMSVIYDMNGIPVNN